MKAGTGHASGHASGPSSGHPARQPSGHEPEHGHRHPPGRAPRLVLLHGLGGSATDWADAAKAIHRSPPPLALDLPGFGDAPKPRDGYDPGSLARWLLAELERRGIPSPVVLAGHSLGARVAAEAAALEPRRVAGLALISPLGTAGYGFTDRMKWKAMSRVSVVRNVPEKTLRNALSYGFSLDGPGKRGFVARGLASRTGPEGDAVAHALEKSVDGVLAAPPLTDRLRGTAMPLLVVSGAEDPLSPPEEAGKLRRTRPNASFVTLRGLGHYSLLEDPKAVARVLTEFLAAI